jgi:hypothetical protein
MNWEWGEFASTSNNVAESITDEDNIEDVDSSPSALFIITIDSSRREGRTTKISRCES